MKKIIKWLILLILLPLIVIGGLIFIEGHDKYKTAMEKYTLSEYVQNVRDKKNFLSIDEIPKDYQDAVIAVEDHRFRDHGGFDIWGTIRAIINNVVTLSARERW